MFLAWPFALFVLKDRPSDIGQFPDGALQPTGDHHMKARSFSYLLRNYRISGCC